MSLVHQDNLKDGSNEMKCLADNPRVPKNPRVAFLANTFPQIKIMKSAALAVCCLIFLLAGCASQNDVVILDERLMVLERQNQELQQQNESIKKQLQTQFEKIGKTNQSAETDLRGLYARLNADMDAMRQNIALLNGRLDVMDHLVQNKTAEYDSMSKKIQEQMDALTPQIAKIEQRSNEIDQYLNLERSSGRTASTDGNKAKSGTSEAKAPVGDGQEKQNPEKLYTEAKQAYDSGQIEKSRQLFQLFLKSNPDSKDADNAQFWIGETYYREKWYEKAILEYQNVIEKFPKGNKVPAAMLKQGMAFMELGDKSNARLLLKELEKKYPASNEAKIAAKKLKDL